MRAASVLAAAGLLAAAACGDTLWDRTGAPAPLAVSCAAGELSCSGVCLACAAPANGQPACRIDGAPACSVACDAGYLRSGDTCRRATAVSVGFHHTCAVLEGGAVVCWGGNEAGQLGDGTTADRAAPVEVRGLPGAASAVAAGQAHTCAAVAGDVWCWGANATGQLGDGTTQARASPVQARGPAHVTALAASRGGNGTSVGHTCALADLGDVWCWGADADGQLGDGGGTAARSSPAVAPLFGSGVTALAAGERHTCVIQSGGRVQCVGSDAQKQLGGGTPLSSATALAAGASHACAVGPPLQCWGANTDGQVDPRNPSPSAKTAPDLTGGGGGGFTAALLAAGRAHTCAIDGQGQARCFGSNVSGQLGGNVVNRVAAVTLLPGAALIAAGGDTTCALLTDGSVQCWGANDVGQAGTGAASATVEQPATVTGR